MVYLVDFACYKPPPELSVDSVECSIKGKHWPMYSDEQAEFMWKVFRKSGLHPSGTYLPACIHPCHTAEPMHDLEEGRKEAEMVMFSAVQELLDKTGLQPRDIDILVTTCSIFCPTPSMSAMVVNHFKMRPDCQTYHLGGMGCGNGVIGIGLVKQLLKAHPNSNAIFIASEITSSCFYPGRDRTRMVANVIFRMGGAAALLSDKRSWSGRAKYELLHNVRTHTGADDKAYSCMAWTPDENGTNGVFLARDVVHHAGKALELCMREVAPRIMTWRQLGEAALDIAWRKYFGQAQSPEGGKQKEYVPDWTRCVDHFLIHAGGYAVLKGIQEGLSLPAGAMIPSFAALRDYGNTSCSTTWYVLAYTESCRDVRRGDVLLQCGMGGGMEAGVNIWRALRPNRCVHPTWNHLAGAPLTEADLPRGIEAITADDPAKVLAKRAEALRGKAGQGEGKGGAEEQVAAGTAAGPEHAQLDGPDLVAV